jgi:hypothetical protein
MTLAVSKEIYFLAGYYTWCKISVWYNTNFQKKVMEIDNVGAPQYCEGLAQKSLHEGNVEFRIQN